MSFQGLPHGSLQVLWFGDRYYNSSEKGYLRSACPFWLVYFFSAVKLTLSFFWGSILRTTLISMSYRICWFYCLTHVNLTAHHFPSLPFFFKEFGIQFTLVYIILSFISKWTKKMILLVFTLRFLLCSQYHNDIETHGLVIVCGVWVWIFWFVSLSLLFRNRLLYKIESMKNTNSLYFGVGMGKETNTSSNILHIKLNSLSPFPLIPHHHHWHTHIINLKDSFSYLSNGGILENKC